MAKSRLEQVLDLVQPRILELFPGVTFAFGETSVAAHGAPPRVVWFRAEDGSRAEPAGTTARVPQALLERNAAIVAVCWAAKSGSFDTDDAALEALVDAVELALREKVGPSAALPFAEAWTSEGWVKTGKSARVLFTLRMPVFLPALPEVGTELAPVDVGFDDTGKSDTDGILQAKDG